ncbi:MAG: hypothetical protein K5910_09225 [Bacteroidales bacterium]|nr:hypothetical protein [Bacteroidales bacterium]
MTHISARIAARSALLLLLLVPVACRQQSEEVRPTIPVVRDILSGKADEDLDMLRTTDAVPASDIAIIGSAFACERLAEQLSFRDLQDNVDASVVPDGLPDFAGETFACIEDDVPYATVLSASGEEALRHQAVLRVLAALDTVVHISPYDLEGMATKAPSKLVLLADPFLAEYGGFDVDTLMRSTGCDVPVVNPAELMIARAFEEGSRADLSVGILCDPQFDSTGIYERMFARMAEERGLKGATCFVGSVSQRDSVLHRFLGRYHESGQSKPLDVILIDDLSVSPEALKTELAEIISVMNESSMTYGRLIPRNFFFLSAFTEVAAYCYQFLRDNNLFTHNIANPQVSIYRPVPRPDADDGSIILIPGSYVQN